MVCIVAKQILFGAYIAARAPYQTYILYLRLPDRNCVLFVDTLPQISCLVILRQPRQKRILVRPKAGPFRSEPMRVRKQGPHHRSFN